MSERQKQYDCLRIYFCSHNVSLISNVALKETSDILRFKIYTLDEAQREDANQKMHTDVWSVVAQHERELNSVEKLQKLKLITRRTDLELLVAYYKISNKLLKKLLKTKVRIQALLWSVSK